MLFSRRDWLAAYFCKSPFKYFTRACASSSLTWFGGMPPIYTPPGSPPPPARDTVTDLVGLIIAIGHANAVDDANPIILPPF